MFPCLTGWKCAPGRTEIYIKELMLLYKLQVKLATAIIWTAVANGQGPALHLNQFVQIELPGARSFLFLINYGGKRMCLMSVTRMPNKVQFIYTLLVTAYTQTFGWLSMISAYEDEILNDEIT